MMYRYAFITVALKNLKRKTFRTGVLIFAIASLVSTLIFSVSFSANVSSGIQKASDRLGADLLIVPVGARGFAEEFLLESKNKSFYMPKSITENVAKIDGIESVTYQTYLETIGGLCCDIAQTQVIAFNQDTDFIVSPWLQKSLGRRLKRGEALAGYNTDENLGLELLEVEKTLFNNRFTIAGVLGKTGTGLDNALFMNEEDLKDIVERGNSPLKKDEISIIFAKVQKGFDPYHVGKDIEGNIVTVDVVARSEMGREILDTLKDINKVFLISVILASCLAIFLVWAVFSAIVNERAREIGIMRAVGAKGIHIRRLFILEVLILGIIGSIAGIVAGTYLSATLTKSFSILEHLSGGLTFIESLEIACVGLLTGTGICIAGALIPISRTNKLEPFTAIKEG